MLQLIGLDEAGRVALEVFFDVEDIDAAIAELDAAHARYEQERPRSPLENAASRADDRVNALFAERRWDEIDALLGDDVRVDDRRRGLRREGDDHAAEVANARVIADIGVKTITSQVLAIRGERLALTRTVFSGRDQRPAAFHTEILRIAEIEYRRADRGVPCVRPRRLRRRHRRARHALPSWRSRTVRQHVVGHSLGRMRRSTDTKSLPRLTG